MRREIKSILDEIKANGYNVRLIQTDMGPNSLGRSLQYSWQRTTRW